MSKLLKIFVSITVVALLFTCIFCAIYFSVNVDVGNKLDEMFSKSETITFFDGSVGEEIFLNTKDVAEIVKTGFKTENSKIHCKTREKALILRFPAERIV